MNRHRSHPISALGGTCMFGVVGLALAVARPAAAEPAGNPSPPATPTAGDGSPGRRVTVDTPIEVYGTAAAQVSRTIYLNRCTGGCLVHMGTNDARTNTSSIPTRDNATISEFSSSLGQIGQGADAEWAQLVQCMKEVYSPYNVMVTDVKPASWLSYHEAIIAKQPAN